MEFGASAVLQTALLSMLVGATGLTGLVLLLNQRAIGPGGNYLVGFLALVCSIAISDLLDVNGIYRAMPWLEAIFGPLVRAATLLLGPLVYLFISTNVMDDARRGPIAIHALPAAIAVIIFVFVNGPDAWLVNLFGSQTNAKAFAKAALTLFWLAFIGLGMWYLYRCYLAVREHSESLYDFLSTIPGSTHSRLRLLWALVTLPVASIAIEFAVNRVADLPQSVELSASAFRIACLIAVCAFALQATQYQQPAKLELDAVAQRSSVKYANSPLEEAEAVKLATRIEALMREEALHRNPLLTLKDLSQRARAPEHRVSQVLNAQIGENFFDFINRWRVDEAMRLLTADTRKTILEVAFEVGFNARSTFYKAFEKNVGMTPSEYRRQQLLAGRSTHASAPPETNGRITK